MSRDVLIALISIISGGSVAGIITALWGKKRGEHEIRQDDIDSRILAWQQISDKHEQRLERMERKLEALNLDFTDLERYALALEKIILQMDPSVEIPPRPSRSRERA